MSAVGRYLVKTFILSAFLDEEQNTTTNPVPSDITLHP